jgi:hypothetical protein
MIIEWRGGRPRAIFLGWLIARGGAFVTSASVALVVGLGLARQGESSTQVIDAVLSAPMLLVYLLLGCAFAFLGGVVAGRVAGEAEVTTAMAVGGLTLLPEVVVPAWWPTEVLTLAGLVLPVPAAVLGGYYVRAWRRRSAPAEINQ